VVPGEPSKKDGQSAQNAGREHALGALRVGITSVGVYATLRAPLATTTPARGKFRANPAASGRTTPIELRRAM